MGRLFDRLYGDPLVGWWIAGALYVAGRQWWQTDEGLVWVLVLVCLGWMSSNAATRMRKRAEWDPPGDGRPPWWMRLIGHPIIAIPLTLPLALAVGGMVYGFWNEGDLPADMVVLAMFGAFATPLALVCRWALRRHDWKRRQVRPAAAVKPTVSTVPAAEIVVPTLSLGNVGIPDAMAALPPALLELVREGAARVRAERHSEEG